MAPSPRRICQVLGAFHAGDAVGNEALAIRGHLRAAGWESDIFAGRADPCLAGEARPLAEYAPSDDAGTVCLYHFSPGSPATEAALRARGPLVLMYHNVTPARFFVPYSSEMAGLALRGAGELRQLAARTALALAKSEFSLQDLAVAGFARTGVLPVIRAASGQPVIASSPVVRRLYADGRTNVLSVGRLVPNKRIEDLLFAFSALQRSMLPRSRLLLVGDRSLASYVFALERLVRKLRLDQVVFLGHVEEDELRACYQVADVYLSLSEHEGYGVPLTEAMLAGVPVVARDAGAVAETLDGAGVLVREPAPQVVAGLIERLVNDSSLRKTVLAGQQRVADRLRATDFGALLRGALAPVLEAW